MKTSLNWLQKRRRRAHCHPAIPDKKTIFRLTRSYYRPLMKAGVRIYEYTPGFMHAKSYLSDDKIGVVGTINMDYRSLFLHFECGTLLIGCQALYDLKKDCEAVFGGIQGDASGGLPPRLLRRAGGQPAAGAEPPAVTLV